MRTVVIGLGLAAASCAAPPPSPTANDAPIAEIAGRVPGPPQHCVLADQTALKIANRSTLIYRSGKTVFVNQLQGRCGGFGKWDILVTEPMGPQYCAGDLVRSFDPTTKIAGPTCRLGEFIPYIKG